MRRVYNVCLIGPAKSGKSQILNYVIRKQFVNNYAPNTATRNSIGEFTLKNGKRRTFIFTEVPEIEIDSFFNGFNKKK